MNLVILSMRQNFRSTLATTPHFIIMSTNTLKRHIVYLPVFSAWSMISFESRWRNYYWLAHNRMEAHPRDQPPREIPRYGRVQDLPCRIIRLLQKRFIKVNLGIISRHIYLRALLNYYFTYNHFLNRVFTYNIRFQPL
jgi:hypothetical protein